jgi:hypothetical protein
MLTQLMVATNFVDMGIQQSYTTSKELTFHLSLSFRMDTLSWERKLKPKIRRFKIRNWVWDRILKRKIIYGKTLFRLSFWNVYPMKKRPLPLFLLCTRIHSLKLHIKLRLSFELGNENLNKVPAIYK